MKRDKDLLPHDEFRMNLYCSYCRRDLEHDLKQHQDSIAGYQAWLKMSGEPPDTSPEYTIVSPYGAGPDLKVWLFSLRQERRHLQRTIKLHQEFLARCEAQIEELESRLLDTASPRTDPEF